MPRTGQNFDLYKGDTRQVMVDLAADTPSLVGGSAQWRMALARGSAAVDTKLTKKTADGTLTIQSDGGGTSLVFVVVKTDLDAVGEGVYYHEAEITEADGKTHTVATGQVRVIATMTP